MLLHLVCCHLYEAIQCNPSVRCRAGIIDGEFSAEQCERLSAALYNIEALLEVSEQKAATDNP